MKINIKNKLILLLTTCMLSNVVIANNTIAYLAHSEGFWQVWIMQSDGSNKQKITASGYDKSHLSWYPDGKHILVNGNQGGLHKVNVQTRQEKIISLPIKGTVDAVISPDGSKIAFSLTVADSRDNNHIWVADNNGENLKKLTNMGGLQHEPVWSPDGEWIYFLSGDGKQYHDVWRVSLKTKSIEQITVHQLFNFDVSLSAQGKMAISSNRDGNYEIWIQDVNGFKQFTYHDAIDSRPTWSSDSQTLAFESARDGVMNIWSKSLQSNQLKQLTNEKTGARYPVWFTDYSKVNHD